MTGRARNAPRQGSTTDFLLAAGSPDAPAVVEAKRVVTYGQLRADVARILAALDARGVAPGARR